MKNKTWLRRVPLSTRDPHTTRPATTDRVLEHLDDAAAMELLTAAPYGRIVFVRDGEPEIRPMSHLVDVGEVVVRTRLSAALAESVAQVGGLPITYEADHLDLEQRTAWSVIVSGTATQVADPDRHARYESLLQNMLAGPDDTIIAIRPKTVSAIRIVAADAAG